MTAASVEKSLSPYWKIPLALAAFALLVVVAGWIVASSGEPNTDFFTLWLGGHLAAAGQNPYSAETWVAGHHEFGVTWIPNETYIYPLPLSLVFLPLGMLPLYAANVLWVLLSECMILVSLALLLRLSDPAMARRYTIPLIAGFGAFQPTMLTLHNGQLDALMLLAVAGLAVFWEKGRWRAGGILLAFLFLKPNIGVPLIALLALYLLSRKQADALLAAAASSVGLVIVGWLQEPSWLTDFWNAGATKLSQTFGLSPTVWGVSTYFCGFNPGCSVPWGAALGIVLLGGCIYFFITARDRLSPVWVISLAILLTLLLTPYAWSYNQILLAIPLVALTLNLAEAGLPFMIAALLVLAVDALSFLMIGVAGMTGRGVWSAAVPLSVLLLVIWRAPIRPVLSRASAEVAAAPGP